MEEIKEEEMLMKEIFEICMRVKCKIEKLMNISNKTQEFSIKIKALLMSFEAFNNPENPEIKKATLSKEVKYSEIQKPTNNKIIKNESDNNTTILSTSFKSTELNEIVYELFKNENKKVANIAQELLTHIQENKSVAVDDLVKLAKVSKYKTISILAVFVKEKIITKRFEKTFYYEINEFK